MKDNDPNIKLFNADEDDDLKLVGTILFAFALGLLAAVVFA